MDSSSRGLSIPLIICEFGSVLAIFEKKMSLNRFAFPLCATSYEIHGPCIAHAPTDISSSVVTHSFPNVCLPLFADPPNIPTNVAISTTISTIFMEHPLEQHPTQHPENFSESSKLLFTDSTTTMSQYQPIQHEFHAVFPPTCQHPIFSSSGALPQEGCYDLTIENDKMIFF